MKLRSIPIYITAFMVSMMDKVLGKDRSDVCYYGFEANTAHYKTFQIFIWFYMGLVVSCIKPNKNLKSLVVSCIRFYMGLVDKENFVFKGFWYSLIWTLMQSVYSPGFSHTAIFYQPHSLARVSIYRVNYTLRRAVRRRTVRRLLMICVVWAVDFVPAAVWSGKRCGQARTSGFEW